MYKLISKVEEGTVHVLYENYELPHLWMIATNENEEISSNEFCDNLINYAATVDDELFTTEITNFISYIKLNKFSNLQVEGFSFNVDQNQLLTDIENIEYEKVFGQLIDRVEYRLTDEAKQYFNDKRRQYKAQYLSVTKIIVYINIIVYIFNFIFGMQEIQFISPLMSLAKPLTYVSILLAGFTHLSLFHIFFNMSFLMSIGPSIENSIGTKKYIILYFLSLLISGIVVVLFGSGLTAGASGALYGLFAYFICLTIKYQISREQVNNALFMLAINLVFTFNSPLISSAGHVGGLIAGFVIYLIFNKLDFIK